MKKMTVISNYIPHLTPKKPNYTKWLQTYYDDLLYLYYSMNQVLMERVEESAPHDFPTFTRFIYHCSSKHIQH